MRRSSPGLPRRASRRALVGGDLVGTAEIDILNSAATPRFLPLDPYAFGTGLCHVARWPGGRRRHSARAAQASRSGSIGRGGRRSALPGLSAALSELGERLFELRVPSAAAAMLSLDLPTGQVPTVSASDLLLTGPFPLPGVPPRARWQLRFGGRPRLDFAVRSTGNPGVIAAAALAAKYDLAPGLLTCRFEYDLRPSKGTIGEWLFTVDPTLRITDVVVNNRAGWTVEAPTTPGGPRRPASRTPATRRGWESAGVGGGTSCGSRTTGQFAPARCAARECQPGR